MFTPEFVCGIVSRQTVHSWESGSSEPNAFVAIRIAKLYGTTVSNLFNLEGKENG